MKKRKGKVHNADLFDHSKAQTVGVNINFLIGALHGLKEDGREDVRLTVEEDKPVLLDDIFLIAEKVIE